MIFNWQKYDIDISKLRGGKSTCPKCSHTRKHKSDLCLSVDVESGLFNCHNCDFKGRAVDFQKKEYTKPVPKLEKISKQSIQFFEKRGITNNTLLRFKITEVKEWICFNYFRNEELINIKFRSQNKDFRLSKDAELIFYNLDSIKGENSCVIVEGEIDCLTLHECGIYNVVSVPNGASKGSQKLEYLDNCWPYFEGMEKVILAVDSDEAGNSLRDELARRLGKEKCFTVEYPSECKDFNEVLLAHGKLAVVQSVENSRQWPLEGIMTMDEIYPVISDWYEHGYPKGAAARIQGFDELLSFSSGQLTVVTGIPGHGKDEFLNLIMANLTKHEGWSWGICGFEEDPNIHTTKLIEKFTGKAFDFRVNHAQRISVEDYEYGVGMVDKYFKHIHTEKSETDVDSILSIAESLVKRFGIKGFCLNPWNWVDHLRKEYMSETEYVSQALTKIIKFAKKFNVAFFLIAHTTKMQKDKQTGRYEVPTLYSINGSANFFNKAHNGITVYRDYSTNVVDVYVQKVKQSWLGKLGYCSFNYNTMTRQYEAI